MSNIQYLFWEVKAKEMNAFAYFLWGEGREFKFHTFWFSLVDKFMAVL